MSRILNPDDTYHVLTRLTRLAQRRSEKRSWLNQAFVGRLEKLAMIALKVGVETGDPVGSVLAEQLKKGASSEVARRLMQRCNERACRSSVPLREVAYEATRQCFEEHQRRWPHPEEERQCVERARLARALGVR
ncbi:MAG: hypothetical protein GY842_29025, partial [bacterium]|nr:hypothetical protein [bacterium]